MWELDKIQEVIDQYTIPCQPRVLADIEDEFNKVSPSLEEVATLVTNDVGLSAGFMQIANNPNFREHSHHSDIFNSPDEAVKFLGLERTKKVISTLQFRDRMQQTNTEHFHFERFWDSASDVAVVSAYLARRLMCADPQEAYMLGLFRDCGIPILMQVLPDPDYKNLLQQAETHPDKSLPELEDEAFNINHQMVGYVLATHWRLPEVICRAILTFHQIEKPTGDSASMSGRKNILISLVTIAEFISDKFRSLEHLQTIDDAYERANIDPFCLGHLGISEQDLVELIDDTMDRMESLLQEHLC